MALNIKNREVERLASEIAKRTGESKTEAVRKALEERRQRLVFRTKGKTQADLIAFLEREIWSQVPKSLQGRRLSRKQKETILGYGREGV
jgi:antitoxin VapB